MGLIDYGPCEYCILSDADYRYDKGGELISNCYDCPLGRWTERKSDYIWDYFKFICHYTDTTRIEGAKYE